MINPATVASGIKPVRQLNLYVPIDCMAAAPGYIPSLDGLRAISILLVLCAHYLSARVFPGGLGVYVFFVISGFLISRLLFAERKAIGGNDLKNFYERRFLRLYPVISVYTLVIVAFYLSVNRQIDWLQPLSALFYFANYLYAHRELDLLTPAPMPFGIFWSLSLEEHFYLVFPLLFVLVRGRSRALVWIMIGVCAACLAWRLVSASLHPEYLSTSIIFVRTDFRADSIAFGVLLAALCEQEGGRRFVKAASRPLWWAVALATLLLCLLVRDPFFRETIRYTLFGISLMLLISSAIFDPRLKVLQTILNFPAILWIGRLSYSLYVWHYLPRLLGPLVLGQAASASLRIGFDFAVTLLAAVLSYRLVERPILTLRHRLGSRAKTAD